MLNRRHLRIKILQALYAFYQSGNTDLAKGEKELFHSLNKIYDLYIYYLLLFEEVKGYAHQRLEEGKKKRLPSPEDLNPNTRFVDNAVFGLLENNEQLLRLAETRKLSWVDQEDGIRNLFRQVMKTQEYEEYMSSETPGFELDKAFAVKVFKKHYANYELFHSLWEERSIYWNDDIDIVCSMVIKTLKSFKANSDTGAPLLDLYKDPEDELPFVKDLFRKTVTLDDEVEEMIQDKTKNWELERIATMDIILMKMAIAEAMHFQSIPIKVTLNEYIEISKYYSTPKSNLFINGILDKIFDELKEKGKIRKVGRGLIT